MEKQLINSDKLVEKCKDAMLNLQKALDSRDVKIIKTCLSRAETLFDVLGSKEPPSHLKKGADFLNIQESLDKVINEANVKLLSETGSFDSYSRNVYGMFGSPSIRERVHVDEFELGMQETNAVP